MAFLFLSFSVTSCRGFQLLQRSRMVTSSSRFASSVFFFGKPGVFFFQQYHPNHRAKTKNRSLLLSSQNYTFDSRKRNNNKNIITSSKSQTVKKIQALLTKRKKRNEYGQTIVEGPRMVFDLLDNPKTTYLVRQVLLSARDEYELRENYQSRFFGTDDNDDYHEKQTKNISVQLVHPNVFKDCTDTVTPQGIVAIVDIPNNNDDIITTTNITNDSTAVAVAPAISPMYLILDRVSDPGNLGTLLRTSLAVNVAGVILLPNCCDVWNPKAVRSAMGASFQVPIIESYSWNDALSTLKSKGVQTVYAATMIEDDDDDDDEHASPSSVPYYDVNWKEGPSALVIGSEGNGISSEIRTDLMRKKTMTTTPISIRATHIPMGTGIESLNCAVCGSVILFEYSRQCARNLSPTAPTFDIS